MDKSIEEKTQRVLICENIVDDLVICHIAKILKDLLDEDDAKKIKECLEAIYEGIDNGFFFNEIAKQFLSFSKEKREKMIEEKQSVINQAKEIAFKMQKLN